MLSCVHVGVCVSTTCTCTWCVVHVDVCVYVFIYMYMYIVCCHVYSDLEEVVGYFLDECASPQQLVQSFKPRMPPQ